MRYVTIPHTTALGGATKQYWQVVDVDAGLNERNYPKRVVASCSEEGAAEQIAAHFNGVNPHAQHWQAEAEFARRELVDMENRWQGTLDFANVQAGKWRSTASQLSQACAEQQDEIAALKRKLGVQLPAEMLRGQLAEMTKERDALRNQLFETREQRDTAREESAGRLADLKRMSENFQRVLTERDDARELVEHIRGQLDGLGEKIAAITQVIKS